MKKLSYIFFIIVFVVSCTSNTIFKKPKNLISEKEMINLMVDMQIAVAAKSVKNNDGERRVQYMSLVFEKYGIDSARFAESNFYYTTDIDNYNKILKSVQTRLQTMNDEFKEQIKINDSITKKEKKKPITKKETVVKKKKLIKPITVKDTIKK